MITVGLNPILNRRDLGVEYFGLFEFTPEELKAYPDCMACEWQSDVEDFDNVIVGDRLQNPIESASMVDVLSATDSI